MTEHCPESGWARAGDTASSFKKKPFTTTGRTKFRESGEALSWCGCILSTRECPFIMQLGFHPSSLLQTTAKAINFLTGPVLCQKYAKIIIIIPLALICPVPTALAPQAQGNDDN
jgi:hypothetical protein